MLQTVAHAAHPAPPAAAPSFLPHGFCYQWNTPLLAVHVGSDLLIGLAYVVISVALAVLVHRARRDIPFSKLFVMFGLFIVACGMTHFMEIWTLWQPVYWVSGAVKVVTAVASVTTAAVLPRMVPRVHGTVRDAKSARERELAAAAASARAAALEEQNAALARLTEELQAANAELAAANVEARAARAVAEQANAAKSEFLATMSHELRTPLNAVLGYADLLGVEDIAGPLSGAQRGYVDRVTTSARHLLGLIDEVLDLAKVEAGQMTVALQPTAVRAELLAAAALVRPQAEARGLALTVEAPPEAEWRVVADPDRLRQVLVNLLGNAVKFTEPGGRVMLRAELAPVDDGRPGTARPPALAGARPAARLTVTDTGAGIPADRLEAIFEPFVQVEPDTRSVYARRHGGTGLGLAIGRRLARLMGGDLTAESTPGVGSQFTLWLPLAPTPRRTPGWTPTVPTLAERFDD